MSPIKCANRPASAALFVNLSVGSRHTAAPSLVSILDLLLPLRPVRRLHLAPRPRSACVPHDARISWKSMRASPASSLRTRARGRAFSLSSPRRATHAIHNPQTDDDGNEMVLEITPRAAQRLSEIMAKDSNPNLALRIQVESGGCHGFQYLMSLVTLPPPQSSDASPPEGDTSASLGEDDTIFAYADDGSSLGTQGLPKIILDGPSLELLKGSKVDFTVELIGSQFKIVDNPLATSSCGCGTSFDIKI